MRCIRVSVFVIALFGISTTAEAQSPQDLQSLSIEELADLEVTSASKRAEPLSSVPASIYVLTAEDIRRAPSTSLPELLRQVPNLHVRQVDARQWAVSARGFNGYETANKLLALIDGRSIYTTLLSSVFWELHAPLAEDLQQIEVVSGPGGTLYGPNAVNGVINIRTKRAGGTLGGFARGTAAANEITAALRYGFGLGDGGAIRLYGTYVDRADRPAGPGGDFDDGYSGFQGGFRADFEAEASTLTLQGDLFKTDTRLIDGEGDEGGNVLGRWTRQLTPASSLQIQAYYDKFVRRFITVDDRLETFDLQAQYNLQAGRHTLVAGVGARTTKDYFFNGLAPITLDPVSKRLWLGNAFVQDRISLTPTLALIAGLKVEQSSYSGTEVLPNFRVAWQAGENALLWGAVSRAVRTPSRIDRDLQFPPILATSPGFRSEKLIAIEAGYRGQPTSSTSLSLTLFYNVYDDLRTTELAPGGVLPIRLVNGLKGRNWGIEAWAAQQIAPWWRLRAGLATLGRDFGVAEGHVDLTNGESAGNDPDYNATIRSEMTLGRFDLDLALRAVDDLPRPAVPAYVEADLRLGWRFGAGWEFFIAGKNLLHANHDESGDPQRGQLAERSVAAGTRISF